MQNPLAYAERIAYSSKAVLNFTYETAKRFKDSPGVYVEAGVAAGAQIIAMAYGAPNKTIYAFDSFEGIPLPSNRDDQMPGIKMLTHVEQNKLPNPGEQVLESSGATVVNQEDFLTHLKLSGIDYTNVQIMSGWFEITVVNFIKFKEDIAILRLDGDLYNSTWVCLQHLLPKVIKGGCVIIDDWTLQGCQDACKEYFELINYTPNYQFLDGTAYFYK
jgi:macrocin-O-methyltransferase TylF-like protien